MIFWDIVNKHWTRKFIEKVANGVFDVCIIGAGASGAGCVLDAQVGHIMKQILAWNAAEELHYLNEYKKELLEMMAATGKKQENTYL
jgi:hypothetical protein